MKALPFPCIRPAQDRVLEALPQMGSILSGNDALRGAIADGLMLTIQAQRIACTSVRESWDA